MACLGRQVSESLEKMDAGWMLKQAFVADCSLPVRLSWRSLLEAQLEDHMVPSPMEDHPQHKSNSLQFAQRQHMERLGLQTSSKVLRNKAWVDDPVSAHGACSICPLQIPVAACLDVEPMISCETGQ